MAQHEAPEKQPKKRSRVGMVLLVLLVLLIGGAGFLYYSAVKAPVSLDYPAEMAASAPMSPEKRFRVSSADQTVQVALEAADLWQVILDNTGTDIIEVINQELSAYDLTVSGCAIHIDGKGLRLDMVLYYKDTRLVVKVPCEVEFSGQQISLRPSAVKLGVIPLPVDSLLDEIKLEYDLKLPVISQVTRMDFDMDALLLTGPMEEDIRTLVPLDEKLYQTAVFSESLQPIVDALQTEAGYAALLTDLEQDPASMETLYHGLFVMADADVTAEYLDSRFGLAERFFPGIDFSAIGAEHDALSEEVTALSRLLEQFFNILVNDYNDKNFTLSDGEFLKKGEPFQAAQYGAEKYEVLFQRLDPDGFFLILVDAEDGFIRNTSSFYRIADENQQFTQSVDFNKTYILGCVLRSVDGDPFMMYSAEIHEGNTYNRVIKLLPITEEAADALQVPGKFGVWTG